MAVVGEWVVDCFIFLLLFRLFLLIGVICAIRASRSGVVGVVLFFFFRTGVVDVGVGVGASFVRRRTLG